MKREGQKKSRRKVSGHGGNCTACAPLTKNRKTKAREQGKKEARADEKA